MFIQIRWRSVIWYHFGTSLHLLKLATAQSCFFVAVFLTNKAKLLMGKGQSFHLVYGILSVLCMLV